ncbi:MFS transporter [Streptomyces ureilyticus]|uniref:YbfB/YjiJ family MFS transporter n=1 Tax=Streptomyces ureilyticus TaxID=1775131 RepID=A0ABX0DHZ5_9ACTN|nr:MFS transporter [Streptomyces ureilyticus]NGO41145.1 YbfB/YjiJ family MFS transporter [Streptomyces ureilyticus]
MTMTRIMRRPEWHVGLAGLSAIGVTFGFARYGYGLYLPEFRREFNLSVGTVGLIGSASYVGFVVALLLVGTLVARFGPRSMVITGGVCATVGMGLVTVARDPAVLTTGLVLAGMSSGWVWAPYSDVVDRVIPRSRRERVMAVIATGTAFGVVVAGPLALFLRHSHWRHAWLVFAVAALAATVYNALVLPGGPHRAASYGARERSEGGRARSGPGRGWFLRRRAIPLYLTAVSYGLVGAVYWAYAIEAIAGATGSGSATAPVFWTLMGLAGTAGALTGHAITRYGLRRTHVWLFTGLAVAVALLGLAPGSLPAVAASAVLYGPCFMAGSALLAVWSYYTFPEQPSTGFTATILFVGLGTITGPATLGALADSHGLRSAFLVTAAVAATTLLVRPGSRPGPSSGTDQSRNGSRPGRGKRVVAS